MEINSNKNDLLHGVQTVQRAVASKNTMPVLSGILLKAKDNLLSFVATDLELGIECYVPVSVKQEGGVVLPAKYLSDIVRKLPDIEIQIKVNKDNNNTSINYGNSELDLLGLPADDFPILPSLESGSSLMLKQDIFKNMIKQVGFATSSDESRPVFTGILMEIEKDQVKLVATDTHRLAFKTGTIENNNLELEKSVIIPGKTLIELNRIMKDEDEEVKIFFGDNQVVFEMPGVRLISRLIEGQFPNYRQVIPQGCNTKIKLNTKNFLEAVERASLMAREGANYIKLTVSQENMIINSNSPEIGQIEEQMDIDFEGEEVQVAFNSKYLIDVLKIIDSKEILLELNGSLSPGIIKPADDDDYIYLILPIRIV